METGIKKLIPPFARNEIRQLAYHAGWLLKAFLKGNFPSIFNLLWVMAIRVQRNLKLVFRNSRAVLCEICGWQGNHFYPYTDQGVGFWLEELCPQCHSLSRHRLVVRYFHDKLYRDKKIRVLEIGPWGMKRVLDSFSAIHYVGVDLRKIPGNICADATRLPFLNGSFDAVLCLNVLYGMPNDRQAVNEMSRVCKSGGKVLVSEPIGHQDTGEPFEKTKEFEQAERSTHGSLRWYGLDFGKRFLATGLDFTEDRYAFHLPSDKMKKYGLTKRIFFLGTKKADS